MTVKEELYRLVDQLADSELETARHMLERLAAGADDDSVTPEELAEMEEGAAQIERGESITVDEFKRKYHL
jgi:predicted transcriptional regulator